MKKCTLGLVAALLLSTTAFAADLPSKAAPYQPVAVGPTWTGFYVGVNGGFGWQQKDEDITGANAIGNTVLATGAVPSVVATRGDGALAGGTLGYNWQLGAFVLGPEVDFDWSNIKGSGSQVLSGAPFRVPVSLSTTGDEKLEFLGTVRARLGYLISPSTLVYATGGGAFGHVKSDTNIVLTAPKPFGASASNALSATKWGWVAGAGIEHQFANRWSVKAEYNYVDLGSESGTLTGNVNGTPVAFATKQEYRYHIAKLGLNYRFW